MTGVSQWVGCPPAKQKIAGSIPGQGIELGNQSMFLLKKKKIPYLIPYLKKSLLFPLILDKAPCPLRNSNQVPRTEILALSQIYNSQ